MNRVDNQMSVLAKHFLLILSLLFIIPTIALAQNVGTNMLFEINEPAVSLENSTLSQALTVQSRRDVLQSLPLTVNEGVLDQIRSKMINSFQMIDVNGNLITVEIRRIIEQLNNDWSVTGYVNGNPINSFTLSYSDGKMLSSIRNITSHTFMEISYRSENDSHYLLEVDPHKTDRIACGFDHSDFRTERKISKSISNQNFPQSTHTAIIDVMIVYTPAAETWALSDEAGGVGIQNIINQSMALAQSTVDNSKIDLEFRLVHAAKVNYTETVKETEDGEENDSAADLDNLTNGDVPDVHELREQYKADLVAMFTDVEDTGGIAWMGTGAIDDAEYAFSITRVQQAANTSTHAHEMGHNMGNNHSRNQKEAPAEETGGIFEYSTGWRWIGNDGETYISVMSYDEPADDDENGKDEDGNPIYGIQVDYFSNPDINFQGVPTGSYSGKYAPADASRSMREVMSTVSNFRVADQDDGDSDDDDTIDTSAKPENLTLVYSDGTITLNWDEVNSGQLSGYNIYRSTNSNNLQFYQLIESDNTTFSDSPTESMFYAVSASYGSNNESALSNIISFYQDQKTIDDEWQLISIPLKNGITEPLQVVEFNQVYTSGNSILAGKGYWVRNNTQSTINIAGEGFINGDVDINSGWNLIGGPADTFLISNISDPQNILSSAQVYEYSMNERVYSAVNGSLSPGNGYWIHAEESGTIRFQIPGTQSGKIQNSRVNRAPISGLHRLEFISNGIVQDFWISDKELHSNELNHYLLPPIAPNGFLDIRSQENYSITDQTSQYIHLTSDIYPVAVNFYKNGQDPLDTSYRLVGIKGQDEIHFNLTGQQIEIPFQMDSFRLERVNSSDLITEFKLHSNYPNPFNPATNIRYELPQQSPVRIEVFDIVGRRIALLVDTAQQSGSYTVQFDGSGIASGLYLLRFQAGRFSETRQITLIK